MLFLKRVVLIMAWSGTLGAHDQTDGSHSVEPSHFFIAHPLVTLEDILEDYPELEDSFHNLSPQERAELSQCIAALSDAFLSVFLEQISG